MKRNLLTLYVALAFYVMAIFTTVVGAIKGFLASVPPPLFPGHLITRARTRDVAFQFRMGAGFPGDVNRTHPASITPNLMDTTNPVAFYGHPVLINTSANTVRGLIAGDTAVTKIAGILVRPYPTQQTSGGMSASLGNAVPPVGPSVCDVLEDGFILAKQNDFAGVTVTKGGPVYVWTAASTGAHVQGGFEGQDYTSDAIALTNAYFTGPADASGVVEIQVFRQ